MDLSPDKVLFAEGVRTVLVKPSQIVFFVLESHFARELVNHGPNENTSKVVVVLIPTDFTAVLKACLFEAKTVDRARLQAQVDGVLQVALHRKIAVGSVGYEVTPRGVMASLLKVELGAVLPMGLIRFSKNGVERLREELVKELPTEVGRHHELEPLHGIRRVRSSIHVNGHRRGEGCALHET